MTTDEQEPSQLSDLFDPSIHVSLNEVFER